MIKNNSIPDISVSELLHYMSGSTIDETKSSNRNLWFRRYEDIILKNVGKLNYNRLELKQDYKTSRLKTSNGINNNEY